MAKFRRIPAKNVGFITGDKKEDKRLKDLFIGTKIASIVGTEERWRILNYLKGQKEAVTLTKLCNDMNLHKKKSYRNYLLHVQVLAEHDLVDMKKLNDEKHHPVMVKLNPKARDIILMVGNKDYRIL